MTTGANRETPLTVWRFTDGKRGHDNQSIGLLDALQEHLEIDRHDIALRAKMGAARGIALLSGTFPEGLPRPHLCIGAGHGTHLALLATRWKYGAKTVVLMKPSLPRSLFDLCIVPEHDQVSEATNVICTRGVLNRIRARHHRPEPGARLSGLILLGGPSKHHHWDEPSVVQQVGSIAARDPAVHWTLGTSRRTPETTLQALRALGASDEFKHLSICPVSAVDEDWLPRRLSESNSVWVSEDSVSMIYEALSAGAATGLIAVPRARPNQSDRVADGIAKLVTDAMVVRHAQWLAGTPLVRPSAPLDEAGRCALRLVDMVR